MGIKDEVREAVERKLAEGEQSRSDLVEGTRKIIAAGATRRAYVDQVLSQMRADGDVNVRREGRTAWDSRAGRTATREPELPGRVWIMDGGASLLVDYGAREVLCRIERDLSNGPADWIVECYEPDDSAHLCGDIERARRVAEVMVTR